MLPELPEKIDPDERLGRHISSKGNAKNNIPNRVFMDAHPAISVDRISLFPIDKAAEIAKNLGTGFYGWAIMTASAVNTNGRKLKYDPTPENPLHTHIILPDNTKETRRAHAQQLADIASFMKCP